jgi:16S rRNA (cytidine1402-2'-O)-methyltransferase
MMRYTDAYERRKRGRVVSILDALAEGDIALVSEAGMPGLSDPGYELIRAALERGVPIIPVPGPTAITTALSVLDSRYLPHRQPGGCISDCGGTTLLFLGFLPRSGASRRETLASLVPWANTCTIVIYEAPHRLVEVLADLADLLGDRPIAAAGELTKLFEHVQRGTAGELLAHYRTHPPRGEFTLAIGPTSPAVPRVYEGRASGDPEEP